MRKSIFIVLILIFATLSCTTQAPDFTGEWQLDYIEVGEEKMYSNHLSNPKYYFDNEGTYAINVAGIIQKGTWKYKNDVIVLKDANSNKTEIKILELDAEKFIYSIEGEEGFISIVRLKK
jgi:uncharacterized lipoprotein YehR (DUF1307 family)